MVLWIIGFLMVAWLFLISFMLWYLSIVEKEIRQINRRLTRLIRGKE